VLDLETDGLEFVGDYSEEKGQASLGRAWFRLGFVGDYSEEKGSFLRLRRCR
jgi:hypothetical protein